MSEIQLMRKNFSQYYHSYAQSLLYRYPTIEERKSHWGDIALECKNGHMYSVTSFDKVYGCPVCLGKYPENMREHITLLHILAYELSQMGMETYDQFEDTKLVLGVDAYGKNIEVRYENNEYTVVDVDTNTMGHLYNYETSFHCEHIYSDVNDSIIELMLHAIGNLISSDGSLPSYIQSERLTEQHLADDVKKMRGHRRLENYGDEYKLNVVCKIKGASKDKYVVEHLDSGHMELVSKVKDTSKDKYVVEHLDSGHMELVSEKALVAFVAGWEQNNVNGMTVKADKSGKAQAVLREDIPVYGRSHAYNKKEVIPGYNDIRSYCLRNLQLRDHLLNILNASDENDTLVDKVRYNDSEARIEIKCRFCGKEEVVTPAHYFESVPCSCCYSESEDFMSVEDYIKRMDCDQLIEWYNGSTPLSQINYRGNPLLDWKCNKGHEFRYRVRDICSNFRNMGEDACPVCHQIPLIEAVKPQVCGVVENCLDSLGLKYHKESIDSGSWLFYTTDKKFTVAVSAYDGEHISNRDIRNRVGCIGSDSIVKIYIGKQRVGGSKSNWQLQLLPSSRILKIGDITDITMLIYNRAMELGLDTSVRRERSYREVLDEDLQSFKDAFGVDTDKYKYRVLTKLVFNASVMYDIQILPTYRTKRISESELLEIVPDVCNITPMKDVHTDDKMPVIIEHLSVHGVDYVVFGISTVNVGAYVSENGLDTVSHSDPVLIGYNDLLTIERLQPTDCLKMLDMMRAVSENPLPQCVNANSFEVVAVQCPECKRLSRMSIRNIISTRRFKCHHCGNEVEPEVLKDMHPKQ